MILYYSGTSVIGEAGIPKAEYLAGTGGGSGGAAVKSGSTSGMGLNIAINISFCLALFFFT